MEKRKNGRKIFNVVNFIYFFIFIKLKKLFFNKIEEKKYIFFHKIEFQLIIFINQRMKQKLLSKEYQHIFLRNLENIKNSPLTDFAKINLNPR